MEGIQHRLDCPARKHLNPEAAEVVRLHPSIERGVTLEHRRCRFCHRSAIIQHTTEIPDVH